MNSRSFVLLIIAFILGCVSTICYGQSNPEKARMYNEEGIKLRISSPEKSIKLYEKAILEDPNYKIAYNNLIVALLKLKKYERASNVYYKYLIRFPNDFYSLFQHALLLDGLNKKKESEKRLMESLEKINAVLAADPKNSDILAQKAFIVFAMGDDLKFREIINKIRKTNPNSYSANIIVEMIDLYKEKGSTKICELMNLCTH